MKTPFLLLLSFGSLLATQAMDDTAQTTPEQAVNNVPETLTKLHDATENLQIPPDYAAAAFLNAFSLSQAADECVARKEIASAGFLYKEALGALCILQSKRPDWQPKVVSYRIRSLHHKMEVLLESASSEHLPLFSIPTTKSAALHE